MPLSKVHSKALGLEITLSFMRHHSVIHVLCVPPTARSFYAVVFCHFHYFHCEDEGTSWETTKIMHSVCFGHSGFSHIAFVQKTKRPKCCSREQHHGSICRDAECIKLPPSLSGNTVFLFSIEKQLTVDVFCLTHVQYWLLIDNCE